jgi:hypothetical protein
VPPRNINVSEIMLVATIIATLAICLRLGLVNVSEAVLIASDIFALLLVTYLEKLSAR